MNIERMLILADHLKTVPHAPEGSINTGPGDVSRFNMNHYICGTAACIGHRLETRRNQEVRERGPPLPQL